MEELRTRGHSPTPILGYICCKQSSPILQYLNIHINTSLLVSVSGLHLSFKGMVLVDVR